MAKANRMLFGLTGSDSFSVSHWPLNTSDVRVHLPLTLTLSLGQSLSMRKAFNQVCCGARACAYQFTCKHFCVTGPDTKHRDIIIHRTRAHGAHYDTFINRICMSSSVFSVYNQYADRVSFMIAVSYYREDRDTIITRCLWIANSEFNLHQTIVYLKVVVSVRSLVNCTPS